MGVKKKYLVLIGVLMMSFSVTSFDMENYSFDNNTKEYFVFFVGLIIGVYYLLFKKE